jgi:DNA-binding GntR family transcriptional regulator
MTDSQRLDRESLAKQAAARLRDEILSGAAPPGERLVVRDLVERWGVSHIPIREALRELEAESLVESRPRHGVVVAGVDIDELADLYRLRRLLEVDAVRRAFGHFTDDHVERARGLLDDLLALTPQQWQGNWWEAHRRYHWVFLEPGLSPWATRLLQLVWQSCERYQRLYTLVFGSVDDANHEHDRILSAAAGGDVDVFLDAWLVHLDHTERTIASGYRARHDGDGAASDDRES